MMKCRILNWYRGIFSKVFFYRILRPSWGVGGEGETYVPCLNFKHGCFTIWGVGHVLVGIYLTHLHVISPHFIYSCVVVSRPCRLSELYPNRASTLCQCYCKGVELLRSSLEACIAHLIVLQSVFVYSLFLSPSCCEMLT